MSAGAGWYAVQMPKKGVNRRHREEIRLRPLGSRTATRSDLRFDLDLLATGWRTDRRGGVRMRRGNWSVSPNKPCDGND